MYSDHAVAGISLSYARQILGPCELAADCSWPHRMSSVLCLRDVTGMRWFLKRHRDQHRYVAEVTAYRQWVPVLGDSAPLLRAFDDRLQTIILSAVPGEPARWPFPVMAGQLASARAAEAVVQRDAGAVLRRLHEAQPAIRWSDFGPAKLDEFDQLRPQAASLLTDHKLAAARASIEAMADLGGQAQVPCHRDYTPRNWLVGASRLYVIDFEWSRTDVWVSDLARLHLGAWHNRPDLREAFLQGYGRELHDFDRAILQGCAVLTAVWLLIKAHQSRQPSFEDGSRTALRRLLAARR